MMFIHESQYLTNQARLKMKSINRGVAEEVLMHS